jgi:hypothetical protein
MTEPFELDFVREHYEPHYISSDDHIVRDEPCPDCGMRMTYEGYCKDVVYRAFAVCHQCGRIDEF